jgi:hypothetical protein
MLPIKKENAHRLSTNEMKTLVKIVLRNTN